MKERNQVKFNSKLTCNIITSNITVTDDHFGIPVNFKPYVT